MKKLLIVDDEEDIREILQFNLETEGYEVTTAPSAEEALLMPMCDFSLILLDVMMEGMSGFQMANKLKQHPETANIPIIFITALGDENNTVKGLNIGADDYISKPLSIKEVKARVAAVLRRTEKTSDMVSETIEYKSLCLNLASKLCTIDKAPVTLTKLEFELLALLLNNRNKILSREEILRQVWPDDTYVLDRTVDVNITRLRKKIGDYGKHIITRIGYGYFFEA